MREHFRTCLNSIFAEEGVYSNDPDDAGGETYMGIARKMNPKWAGWAIIDAYKKDKTFPKCLLKNEELNRLVDDKYLRDYWLPIGGDQISNFKVVKELFDSAVNMGPSESIKESQIALGITPVNGKIDALMIKKLNTIK